ncbi:MAG: aldehyde dehydrogenase family protein [Myxococcota bacterium]|nr:aldehyde dehydrogenase family protein [Myxococcota bacterium]
MSYFDKFDQKKQHIGVFDGAWQASGKIVPVVSPIDGEAVAEVVTASSEDCHRVIASAHQAFLKWREVPAPERAEVVRQIGVELRAAKENIAALVTLEMGKTIGESRGEVQEMIDVCDFATGLGRQIGGLTLPSERRAHRLIEQWHPLGPAAVVTAFNFPVAVWSWNTALALVCGDPVIWKPSSNAPLSAIACTAIAAEVLTRSGYPSAVTSLVVGSGRDIGDTLISDPRVPLVSYTGSVPTGRHVGKIVQERFGRPLLELGGNNAVIVTPNADLVMAVQAVFFGAVGTSGQRCTTTRRLIVHQSVKDEILARLKTAYGQVSIGDPRDEAMLMGPLVDRKAVSNMQEALTTIQDQGGRILFGGEILDKQGGCYVTPCVVEATPNMRIVAEETFAPILYVIEYQGDVDTAIAINNDVPQGLSSAVFSNDIMEIERFLGATGSDCGLANVNTGTSGAEIGGAFGGEKETGGGRESGSDAWKAYMRRQTSVINASGNITLAQGIRFDVDA